MVRARWLVGALALLALPQRVAEAAPVFKHIIIVVQENRTVDNMFGSNPSFEPGVDIATSGVTSTGKVIQLFAEPLAACFDPAHSDRAFLDDLKGFDLEPIAPTPGCTVPANAAFTYVDNSTGQIQPYFDIAEDYGFANDMFQTNEGPSYPAHQFLFAGTSAPKADSPYFMSNNGYATGAGMGCPATKTQTVKLLGPSGGSDGSSPIFPCVDHPTLSDALEAVGATWRYYAPEQGSAWSAPDSIKHICGPVPYNKDHDACAGPDYTAHVVLGNPAQALSAIAACDLQNVTWIMPSAQESDHAGANNGTGPAWVASIVNAIGNQPTCANGDNFWDDTAIFITWDDWGGFYDHVAPFEIRRSKNKSMLEWGDGYTYGFRVPLLVVSAYTPAGFVDNTVHDFGSLLYFVEENFNTGFIGPSDSTFTQYADYQAAARGDTMKAFFPLSTPRSFVPIASPLPPSYFILMPNADIGPDND